MKGKEFSPETINALYKVALRSVKEIGAYVAFKKRIPSQKKFCEKCLTSDYLESSIINFVWGPIKSVFDEQKMYNVHHVPFITSINYIELFCYKILDISTNDNDEKKRLKDFFIRLVDLELNYINDNWLSNTLKHNEEEYGKDNIERLLLAFLKIKKKIPKNLT